MAKKFIHIVEHLQYSNLKDEYIKHDFECFSSCELPTHSKADWLGFKFHRLNQC